MDSILVGGIVLIAAILTGRALYRSATGRKGCSCGDGKPCSQVTQGNGASCPSESPHGENEGR